MAAAPCGAKRETSHASAAAAVSPCRAGRSEPSCPWGRSGIAAPGIAYGTEMTVVGLLTDAAAPALRAAASSNDPALAGQELLNRSLASASTRTQRLGPAWLERVRFDLSFDPAFQPRYSLAVTQPLLASSFHDSAIDLQGRVVDAAGATGGDLRLHYRGRWYEQDVTLGVQGGAEDLKSRNSSVTVSVRSSVYGRCGCARTCTTMFPHARPVGRSPSDGWMATIWKSVPRSRSCPGPGCGPTASGRSTWTARPSARTIASACG